MVGASQVAEADTFPPAVTNLTRYRQGLIIVLNGSSDLPQITIGEAQAAEARPFCPEIANFTGDSQGFLVKFSGPIDSSQSAVEGGKALVKRDKSAGYTRKAL